MSPTNRREARRLAMCAIYATEATGYTVGETLPLLIQMKGDSSAWPEFARQLCFAVERHKDEITADVQAVLENWQLDRVAPVERAILKLGCAEISYFPDIPPRVTINEYIELAKDYANDNAPSFINGVLDRLAQRKNKKDFKAEKTPAGPQVYSASGLRVPPSGMPAGERGNENRSGEASQTAPLIMRAGSIDNEEGPVGKPGLQPEPQAPVPPPFSSAPEDRTKAAAVNPERISSRWARELYEALTELGGSASMDELYQTVEKRGRVPLAPEWQMMVQGALERHSADSLSFEGNPDDAYENLFAHLGRRQWGIRKR